MRDFLLQVDQANQFLAEINNDTINIASWQKSTEADNIQITGLNLDRGIRYFSYLRAVDSATNISSVLKSDGVEFDNTPPDIKSIYPLIVTIFSAFAIAPAEQGLSEVIVTGSKVGFVLSNVT